MSMDDWWAEQEWVKAEDRCIMGGPLGDTYQCWGPANGRLFCAACQHDIDHGTTGTCHCPGCRQDYMADVRAGRFTPRSPP